MNTVEAPDQLKLKKVAHRTMHLKSLLVACTSLLLALAPSAHARTTRAMAVTAGLSRGVALGIIIASIFLICLGCHCLRQGLGCKEANYAGSGGASSNNRHSIGIGTDDDGGGCGGGE